jgi:hypothetical protein
MSATLEAVIRSLRKASATARGGGQRLVRRRGPGRVEHVPAPWRACEGADRVFARDRRHGASAARGGISRVTGRQSMKKQPLKMKWSVTVKKRGGHLILV